MTPGPGNASVQSPFVSSSAAAWKWQTSHGLEYMLVHTKPIIYLLLFRLKSPVNTFQWESGALSSPSRVRRRCQGRLTMWAGGHESLAVSFTEAWEAGAGAGEEVRMWPGGTGLPIPCCYCWPFTLWHLIPRRWGGLPLNTFFTYSLSLHWSHTQPGSWNEHSATHEGIAFMLCDTWIYSVIFINVYGPIFYFGRGFCSHTRVVLRFFLLSYKSPWGTYSVVETHSSEPSGPRMKFCTTVQKVKWRRWWFNNWDVKNGCKLSDFMRENSSFWF